MSCIGYYSIFPGHTGDTICIQLRSPPNATTIPSIHREGGCSCHHTMIRHALKPIPRKELKNRKKEKQRFAGKKLDGAVLHNMLIVDGATLHLQLAKVNLFPLT